MVACSDVITLTADSFEDSVKKHDVTCPHCHTFMPTYKEIASKLKKDGIATARLNCEKYHDKCVHYDVSSYPTLKIFQKGEFFADYEGNMESEDIIEFMRKTSEEIYKSFYKSHCKRTMNDHIIFDYTKYTPRVVTTLCASSYQASQGSFVYMTFT
ncbi:uncharacterized protein LOC130656584 [Hydractinia symbiolongicarpus]|uniref:uncharacterized protein LOC130656584 n=1 Tax=Hydractinia symbiolongicarpus TaxID=13093 RepID=UPI00254E1287|nr:uncharacterized protein LOC130656584 [Hydractinia symbiolongicarpus]